MPTLIAAIDARLAKQGGDEFTAGTNQIVASANKANAAIGGMDTSMSKVARSSTAAAGVIGGFVGAIGFQGIASVVSFTKETFHNAAALQEMSERLGVSVETLSTLDFAAKQTGTSMAGAATGIRNFRRVLNEASQGSKSAAQDLAALGITQKEYTDLSSDTDKAIARIGRGLAGIEDPGKRTATAMAVLGRSGSDLLPLLTSLGDSFPELRKELERTGLLMTGDFAQAADQMDDALTALKGAFAGMLQFLTPIIDLLGKSLVGVGQLATFTRSLIESGGDFDVAIEAAGQYRDAIEALGKKSKEASEGLDTAAKATENLGAQAKKSIGPVRTLEEFMEFEDQLAETRKDHIATLREEVDLLKKSTLVTTDHAAHLQAEKDTYGLAADEAKKYVKTIDDLIAVKQKLTAERGAGAIVGDLERQLTLLRQLPSDPSLREFAQQIQGVSEQFEDLNNGIDSNLILQRQQAAILDKIAILREEAIADTNKQIQAIRDENDVVLQSNDERERTIALRRFDRAFAGIGSDPQIQQLRTTLDLLIQQRQELARLRQFADDFARAFADGLENAVLQAESLTDALRSVYQEIVRISFRFFVTNPLNNFLSGLFGSLFGGLSGFGSLRGNVFQGGSPIAHQQGGIIGAPIAFPMSNGRYGTAVEDGRPEAIAPLGRDSRGRLGIHMIGGGGKTVVQNITIKTADAGSFRASKHQWANDLRRAARDS